MYESVHGEIPVDTNGRTYEIHHIDGNHENNDLNNLKAVTIQEHFDIHYSQNDYSACALIATRMNKTPEELSAIMSFANKKRVAEGTNPFVGPSMNQKMIDSGIHPWLGGEQSRKNANKLVAEGKHPFVGGKI